MNNNDYQITNILAIGLGSVLVGMVIAYGYMDWLLDYLMVNRSSGEALLCLVLATSLGALLGSLVMRILFSMKQAFDELD